MQFTDKDIQEYKRIYFKEYWEEISDKEALKQWIALVNLMKNVAFPENKDYLSITARTLDERFRYDDALPYYLTLYQLDTLDTLVKEELSYLQRKIAYLQRKRQEQRILADSLSKTLLEEL